MRTRSRLLLTAAGAALAMALAVGTATANRLQTSSQTFRSTFVDLGFIGSNGSQIFCALTLEGSFHSRTITKMPDLLIGYVTNAVAASPCRTGTVRILPETLPWHIRYLSWTGTLPTNITGISVYVIGAGISIEPGFFFSCLALTTAAAPAHFQFAREPGGRVITMAPVTSAQIPLTGATCFASTGSLNGAGEVFVLNSTTTRITVILI